MNPEISFRWQRADGVHNSTRITLSSEGIPESADGLDLTIVFNRYRITHVNLNADAIEWVRSNMLNVPLPKRVVSSFTLYGDLGGTVLRFFVFNFQNMSEK